MTKSIRDKIPRYLKFNQNLETFKLIDLELNAQNIKAILESSKDHKNLKKMDLCFSSVQDYELIEISEQIKSFGVVKAIRFAERELNEETFKKFSENLEKNFSLKKLNFLRVPFNSSILSSLCHSLQSNHSIVKLDLDQCDISVEILEILCNFIASHKTLKHLSLSDNPLGDQGIQMLSHSLRLNTTLESLNINNTEYKMNCIEKFLYSLHSNFSLKKIIFTETNEFFPLLFHFLKINKSVIDVNPSFMIDPVIGYLVQSNKEWKPSEHSAFPHHFKEVVFSFVCCLKIFEKKNLLFKFGKFVFFEMIKRIDRKAFLNLIFPQLDLNNCFPHFKKRKRSLSDESQSVDEN